MTATDNPDRFKERWNNHIDEFERLKLSIPVDEWDRLEEAQDELREIVEKAADNPSEGEEDE